MEERTLARRLRRLRPEPARTSGPVVSIVVANRDGEHHLRRLLDGLDKRTRYRSFEVIVVDNASTDGSIRLVEEWGGPSTVLRNTENQSFSRTNNQGIRAASGELVLLANNDIDPIGPDWLGSMVETLLDGAVGVGAMLVHPARPQRLREAASPDLTVQHLGIAFRRSKWGVRAVNIGAGSDPLAIDDPGRRDVPAVTAACLLARRADLLEIPLDEEYWYGSEDWDLNLRLRQRGEIVLDERAVLFHHEFGTQDRHLDDAWLAARHRNHHRFNDLWGPSLMRRLRSEATGPQSGHFFRAPGPPELLVIARDEQVGPAMRFRDDARQRGWRVLEAENRGADVVIACDVPDDVNRFAAHDLSAALVHGDHEHWARSGALDAATYVFVQDRVGKAQLEVLWGRDIARVDDRLFGDRPGAFDVLLTELSPGPDTMRIGVSTAAPDWERAQVWGDTFLGRGLMRAFRRLGHEATELIRPDWRSAAAASCDVVVHLRGLQRRPVARGQWNVLWIISHPDRVEPDEYDDYDIVMSASASHAAELTERLGRPVHHVPQATDTDTFRTGARDVEFEAPVMYVGIARWPNRRAPRWMAQHGRRFHLYGRNWEQFPEGRFLRGEFIANRDLPAAYRSAQVVVADHHGSMRAGGFVANRIFDVLAAGGTVISDDVNGLDELFGDVVPTYSSSHELEAQLRSLLAEPARRRQIARDGRRIVESHHTLDHRAAEILRLLDGC